MGNLVNKVSFCDKNMISGVFYITLDVFYFSLRNHFYTNSINFGSSSFFRINFYHANRYYEIEAHTYFDVFSVTELIGPTIQIARVSCPLRISFTLLSD